MILQKAFKFELKPTAEQEHQFYAIAGSCRKVWNIALAEIIERKDKSEPLQAGFAGLCKQLTAWRNSDEYKYLSEYSAVAHQQKLKDLARAVSDSFKTKDSGSRKEFPKWRKRDLHSSFRFTQNAKQTNIQIDNRRVKLPTIGWVGFRKSKDVVGKINTATVSMRSGKWFVSLQVEVDVPEPIHSSRSAVGIDLGIAKFATLSNGEVYTPLNSFRKLEKKLAKLQRQLKNKKKFSANWKKAKASISKLHSKIANARKDYLHKISNEITNNHGMIAIEDLKICNMSKSAKGDAENHGKNVAAKSGLNKSILDQGWYEFRRQLTYKQQWKGGVLVAVPPHHTSQTCPACLSVNKLNRQSQAHFECIECGFTENADLVGAINILNRAHASFA
jgi:putative transposase